MAVDNETARSGLWRLGLGVLAMLVLARIVGLILSPVELHGDEAQYWSWSRQLDWGYYSKPPLIAWMISLTTGIFGDAEWAIRLAAPIMHGFTALFISLLGRDLYNERVGIIAGALYLLMPAVSLSSGVISTDALLLTFVSGGMFSLNRLRTSQRLIWAAALGVSIGLGVLAKYAMFYFLIGMGLVALFDAATRRALLGRAGGLAALIAIVIIAPNLAWNAANGYETVGHTADNANWGGPLFRPHKLTEFWEDQLVVFGPITLVYLLAAIALIFTLETPARRRLLYFAAFTIPPLLIVSIQAFISRAHGNWAAVAYVGGTLLLTGWVFGSGGARSLLSRWSRDWGLPPMMSSAAKIVFFGLFALGVAINVAGGAILSVAAISPHLADRMCMPATDDCAGEAFKRARGWRATTDAVIERFDAGFDGVPFSAVAVDNRLVFHDVEYYRARSHPNDPLPLRMWLRYADAKSHAEQRAPLIESDGEPVLIVSVREEEHARIAADFGSLTPLGVESISLGVAGQRDLYFFVGQGFAPLVRDRDYEARWRQN